MSSRKWYEWSLVGVLGLTAVGSTIALTRNDYSFFDPLIGVKALVSQRYVEQPDEKAMQAGAINGMLEVLNDPYTVYVPPSEVQDFTKGLTGDFVGIGVQVVTQDGWLTVVTPLEDTPAFKAGLVANDRIVEIEGRSTMGKTTEQCIELLKGEPGSRVSFVVERDGQRIPFTVVRERIVARTVKGFHWNEKSGAGGEWQYFIDPDRRIAYLRLTQFAPTSAAEVSQALDAIGAASGGVGGLILDLRWNPGGVLEDAVDIADLFLSDQVIVSTRGRAKPEEVVRARPEGTLPDFPIAILLNSSSASASEVLAGALAENNRAIVVGTRSFGKGLVQGVHTISPGGGQLKLTEQRYYLPSGRCIQRTDDSPEWGVDPTNGFYVPMTDEQTREMLRILREQMVVGSQRSASEQDRWSDPDWILDRLSDPQLAAAVKAAQFKIDSGEWKPTGQPLPESTAFVSDELNKATAMRDRLERELSRLEQRIEAMETVAPPAAAADLWPDGVDIVGGTIQVFDRHGREVAKLKVSDADLERSLIDAGLRKADE